MERYFLGIDGGGTKTAFLLCDESGAELGRCTLMGCNPVDIGMERTKEILGDGIQRVCAGIPYGAVCVYAGIAGGITGDNREKLAEFLRGFGFAHAENNSDAMNAVAAGLMGQDGVAAIMGTGNVAFTKRGGEYLRTGGFGYLIDKGGDGYSIGRDALRYALYAEQRGENEALLLRLLREKAGGEILPQLGDIYAGGKAYVASFCPAVFEALRGGDETALQIVESNVHAAAEVIREAADKLEINETVPVVLIGGVARQPEVIPMLRKTLGGRFAIRLSDTEPVLGAVRLAMEGVKNA